MRLRSFPDAKNVLLLSLLFPNSRIITIDLPDNDKDFINSYDRNEIKLHKKFVEERDRILSKCKNVKFLQKNSLNLTFENNIMNIKLEEKFIPRRGRINCSLNDKGKWRWFGTQFTVVSN